MKQLSWSLSLVIVGTIAAVDSACTVTVNSGDDGGNPANGTGSDATASDTGALPNEAGPDMGSSSDGGSSIEDTGSGDDGGCSSSLVTGDGGNPSCDQCRTAACCTPLNACLGEPLLDSGVTDCESLISCFNDCISPPADSGVAPGTLASCTMDCEGPDGGDAHSAQAKMDFQALSTCIANAMCASVCH
jgi:hypothetical protein